ncbi:MAG: DUF1573 domain-containing protein [Candidatus Cyclobacteriaceae bacterium M3_2C_046]
MNIKILFFFLLILVPISQTLAQPSLEIKELNYDFGQIQEGNIASHDFIIKNNGDQPLIINSVKASCGCTTPYWTKEPILPGMTGVVSAAYNSKNRPGMFKKSISIFSNAVKPVQTVYIQGVVVKSAPVVNYTEEEMALSAQLITDQQIKAGKIELGQKIPLQLKVKNIGENPLSISAIRSGCNCIIWNNYNQEKISKNEEVVINLIYSPKKTGNVEDDFTIYSNDLKNPQIKIRVIAEIVESLDNKSPIMTNEVIKF